VAARGKKKAASPPRLPSPPGPEGSGSGLATGPLCPLCLFKNHPVHQHDGDGCKVYFCMCKANEEVARSAWEKLNHE
jgi:hypothetical protein